jgi:hypothetical protein
MLGNRFWQRRVDRTTWIQGVGDGVYQSWRISLRNPRYALLREERVRRIRLTYF